MGTLRPAAVVAALALATWKPFVRIGAPEPLGRLDAWAVHGMSHARVDGVDPLQVPLTAALLVCAVLAPRHAGAARVLLPLGLGWLAFVALRCAAQVPVGVVPDLGLLALPTIAIAVGGTRSARSA